MRASLGPLLADDVTCSAPGKTVGMEVDSPPRILPAFSAETLKLRNLLDLHPNSTLKMSYALDVAEFAQWLVGKKNVKEKKKEKKKNPKQHYQPALISRLFHYCALG